MSHIAQFVGYFPMVDYITIECADPNSVRGFALDEIVEELEQVMLPATPILSEGNLIPFAIDDAGMMHPVFSDIAIPPMKMCKNSKMYCGDRMPLSAADNYALLADIVIIDAVSELPLTRLVHVANEFDPESWEVCELLVFYYPVLPELIRLMKRIRNSKLEDFYDSTS